MIGNKLFSPSYLLSAKQKEATKKEHERCTLKETQKAQLLRKVPLLIESLSPKKQCLGSFLQGYLNIKNEFTCGCSCVLFLFILFFSGEQMQDPSLLPEKGISHPAYFKSWLPSNCHLYFIAQLCYRMVNINHGKIRNAVKYRSPFVIPYFFFCFYNCLIKGL